MMKTLVPTLIFVGVSAAALALSVAPVLNGQTVDAALIAKGADLAAIGNCASCHTAEGGKAYAGGRPLSSSLGIVYSTNITPDVDTGIGKWTEAEFTRAMHEGVDRGGRELYPAFP